MSGKERMKVGKVLWMKMSITLKMNTRTGKMNIMIMVIVTMALYTGVIMCLLDDEEEEEKEHHDQGAEHHDQGAEHHDQGAEHQRGEEQQTPSPSHHEENKTESPEVTTEEHHEQPTQDNKEQPKHDGATEKEIVNSDPPQEQHNQNL